MSFLTRQSRFRSDNTLFFHYKTYLDNKVALCIFPYSVTMLLYFSFCGHSRAKKTRLLKQKIIFRPSAVESVFYFSHALAKEVLK